MRADVNFSKIGLDTETLEALKTYTEVQRDAKKVFRLEVGEEAKSCISGIIAFGVLAVLTAATCSIFKTIYAPS